MDRPPSSAYAAWLAVCVIWGTTYLAIRIALETIPPGLLGGLRFTIAGSILCAFVLAKGDRLPPLRTWPRQALIGVMMLAVGNGFVVIAEQWIPSGIAAVSVASAPFWMSGIEAVLGGERLTLRAVFGFITGFCGILVLVAPDLQMGSAGSTHFVLGIILGQVACLGWSIGSSLSKRWTTQGSALGASAVQQLSGGLVTLAGGLAIGEWSQLSFTTRSLGAEIYLIVFGSLGAYSAYVYALQYLPVSTVSLYAYVNPLIAVVLGTLIASEPFSPRIVAAVALVLIGVAIVRSRPQSSGSSDDATSADQSHQEQHDGDNEQNPNEVTKRVAADHPQ